MFSYFQKIKTTIPTKGIDFQKLVEIIKNNPERSFIEELRQLKTIDIGLYKKRRKILPNYTPSCVVKKRRLDGDDDFKKNFITFSSYIYFDIDNLPDVQLSKNEIIKKYGHLVSLVCVSVGGDGLSILVKVSNNISTKEEFDCIWQFIRQTTLKDIIIDPKPCDIGRANYISYDPEVYFNPDNTLGEIECNNITEYTKGISKGKSGKSIFIYNNIGPERNIGPVKNGILLNESFKIIPIGDVLKVLRTKSEVPVYQSIVEMKPVEVIKVWFPHKIKDGTKHSIYPVIIHKLMELNSHLEPDILFRHVFSYLYYINDTFADPPMDIRELKSLFTFVFSTIMDADGFHYVEKRIKNIHFNKNCSLNGNQKMIISNTLNGLIKKNRSILKIIQAREELINEGKKVTQKNIAEKSGLHIITVKRHYKNSSIIDIQEILGSMNE